MVAAAFADTLPIRAGGIDVRLGDVTTVWTASRHIALSDVAARKIEKQRKTMLLLSRVFRNGDDVLSSGASTRENVR